MYKAASFLILILTIPNIIYSQSRNGTHESYYHFHYKIPSTDNLEYLRNDDETVSVYVFPVGGHSNSEIQNQLDGIKFIIYEKLLSTKVQLKKDDYSSFDSATNELQVGVNVLKSNNNYSYVIRLLLKSGAYMNRESEMSYMPGLILWEDVHFGIVNESNYTKIRENILLSIDRLISMIE